MPIVEARERLFQITDNVVWNKDRYPTMVGGMVSKYGEGPFKIVGLRLHTKEALESASPPAHPVAVTVELADGSRREFSGEWFNKK